MTCLTEFFIVSLSILIIIGFRAVNYKPPPIFNIYQRPNAFFYLKVVFIYTVLQLQKLSTRRKNKNVDETKKFSDLDRPQQLSSNANAIDAVYFNGANRHRDHLIVGTARRQNKLVDGFFYLQINESGLGLLETPKLPSTSLYQIEQVEEFGAEGIKLSPVVPMKKWRIVYEGTMKRHNVRNEVVDVRIDAEFSSSLPYFNFDSDIDAWCMAKSMAYEKFSREYFDNLKANHQTHYEQYGDIKGTAVINGTSYSIDVNAVRDHSFGEKREWRNFHRYILHIASAENGDRFNIALICLPISFSRLIVGYVYSAEDKKIHPVSWCDLELYQHGENGCPSVDYAFSFEAGNKRYTMQVNTYQSAHFYISKDWESKVMERLSTFEINGIKGWGVCEWQYRNVQGKNVPDEN